MRNSIIEVKPIKTKKDYNAALKQIDSLWELKKQNFWKCSLFS